MLHWSGDQHQCDTTLIWQGQSVVNMAGLAIWLVCHSAADLSQTDCTGFLYAAGTCTEDSRWQDTADYED